MSDRPYILLDVDGPLNPDRPSGGFREYITRPAEFYRGTRDLPVWLNPEHGEWVKELAEETGGELAWGSSWCGSANEWIGPALGLPVLPFVPIPEYPPRWGPRPATAGHAKALRVVPWVAGRPFVWLDDEQFLGDVVSRQKDVPPHLVVYVSGTWGLTREHVEQARLWLDGRS